MLMFKFDNYKEFLNTDKSLSTSEAEILNKDEES